MVRIAAALAVTVLAGACRVPPPAGPPPAAPANETPPARVLEPFPGIRVIREGDDPRVELDAHVCIEAGWLEQVACGPGSREHESLVVPVATPGQVHAAMLLAGFEPGAPGMWSYEDQRYRYSPPTGAALSIGVRRPAGAGGTREEPIRAWIREHQGRREFPDDPWIFAGSRIEETPEGDIYVADYSGSIIGLVTFGDEVIGFSRVFADQDSVQPAEWEANTRVLPPVGTLVTLIVRAAGEQRAAGE